MNLQELRDALAGTIRDALAGYASTKDVNVYAYNPGALRFPCIVIEPQPEYLDYFRSSGDGRIGKVSLQLRVCFPTAGSAETAARLLDDMIGQSTTNPGIVDIFGAAQGSTARTLGGLVGDCVPLTAVDYGPGVYAPDETATAIPFIGATLPLQIHVARS